MSSAPSKSSGYAHTDSRQCHADVKKKPLRQHKFHLNRFHFNNYFREGLFIRQNESMKFTGRRRTCGSRISGILRAVWGTLELPDQGPLFTVQRNCGQEERQVPLSLSAGGLAGSLPQIFTFLQNLGIPSTLSDLTLALSSLLSAVVISHEKKVLPVRKLKRLQQKGK